MTAPVPPERTANLLGALSLAVSDRMTAVVAGTAEHSETAASAMSALDQFLRGPSVEHLSQVVGLSQSGGVRLVDRLQRDGLVERRPGTDGRTAAVSLTAPGRRTARRLTNARLELLRDVVAALTPSEQDVLAGLAGRMLVGLMREPGATRWTCRLCDLGACGRPEGYCPLEREARARYGGSPRRAGPS